MKTENKKIKIRRAKSYAEQCADDCAMFLILTLALGAVAVAVLFHNLPNWQ